MEMSENEAYKFIGQAVIESGRILEELQSIKSEAERPTGTALMMRTSWDLKLVQKKCTTFTK